MKQSTQAQMTLLILVVTCIGATVKADDTNSPSAPTFARDVAPIFQKHCQDCHRPGETAPMSLLSFEDSRPWAKSIAKVVESRTMPPWHADPSIGEWSNDRRLTEKEIATITQWANSGAPMGDAAHLPPPREFATGWSIGEPDQIVYISTKDIAIAADIEDEYRYFMVNPKFTEDMWVESVELRPGNPAVVHHLLAKAVDLKAGVVDPETDSVGLLGSMSPGRPPDQFGNGFARFIKAGSVIGFEVHYHKEKGIAATDRSMIGFKFAKGPIAKTMYNMRFHFIDFRIPPGDPDYRLAFEQEFQQNVQLHTIMPHMHMRAQTMRVTAITPDAREEVLLNVPKYDFNWQTTYYLKQPKSLPAGSRIRVEAAYDNSTNNPFNPDPTAEVLNGEATTDEMMVAFMDYTVDEEDIPAGKVATTLPLKRISGGEVAAK